MSAYANLNMNVVSIYRREEVRRLIWRLFIGLLGLSVVGGCKKYEPVLPPVALTNTHPVERYKMILTIPSSPGPLNVRGRIIYTIENSENCVPIDKRRSLGGSRPAFSNEIEVQSRKVSEHDYETVFYRDAYRDEDYYGKGICRWTATPVQIIIRGNTSLSVSGSIKTDRLGEIDTRMCALAPSGSFDSCGRNMKINPEDFGKFFQVELTTHKE